MSDLSFYSVSKMTLEAEWSLPKTEVLGSNPVLRKIINGPLFKK